jgi:hypothetical protein
VVELLRAKIDSAIGYVDEALVFAKVAPLTAEQAEALRADAKRLAAAVETFIERSGRRQGGRRSGD